MHVINMLCVSFVLALIGFITLQYNGELFYSAISPLKMDALSESLNV